MGLCSSIALAAPSAAEGVNFETGGELYAVCTSDDNWSKGFCSGLIVGVGAFAAGQSPDLICQPSNVTFVDQERVVVAYLRAHPRTHSLPSPWVVGEALVDAFPCPKKR